MHLLLTDRITCPRCGPDFGLILLAHEVRERRVIRGDFGCANCREQYPVVGGFGDLRVPPRTPLEDQDSEEPGPVTLAQMDDSEGPVRLAALLGVTEGPGTLLLTGPVAGHAAAVGRLIGGVEIVGVDASLRARKNVDGVSRMVSWPGLPFFPDTFKGVLVSGRVERNWVAEAARVTAPSCRLAVLDCGNETREWLKSGGFQILLEEGGIVVAQKPSGSSVPLVPLRRS